MEKIKENTDKLLQFIGEKFESGELNNDSMIRVIKFCGDYLNLKPIEGNSGDVVLLFGVQFVIDNE